MTEVTSTIAPSTPSAPSAQSTGTNNVTTTTITPPSIPSENGSEYQRSYSWKLPMVSIHRPKERTKSEYQREFTWKNDPPSTPSPAPSPAPIAPSPIPQDSFIDTEPIKPTTTTVNNSVDYVGSKLNNLNITNNNNSSSSINELKHNGNFTTEPDFEKFNSNNNAADTWKDGLRNKNSSESKQSTLAKKIVALEANRLSKKSRSYSMYSLHDQLKVCETANDLSNPFDTEYKREFVNWDEYGNNIREEKRHQTTNSDHTLKRRGSWSAPAANILPAPLKWLEDLNIDLGSRAYTREKLQPTVPDSKSIRGITTTITAKRSTRDYNFYDEKRPTTSAEFRDYQRPTTSADIRDYPPRPMTSMRDYHYDDDDDHYYNTRRNFESSHSKKERNPSPLRSATTLGHYKDYYKDTPDVSNQYYDNRERSSRKDYDYDHKYDDRKYDDRKYDDRKYEDKKYDDRKYDDRKYDDSKYEDRKYDDRKRDIVYDDRRRENGYEERKRDSLYDDRRRENGYDDRQRDSYDYDYRRRDNNHHDYDEYYNNNRTAQNSDQEHYNLGHSRNPSYASSNKGSVHDEPTNFSGPPLPYLDAVRHRSSVSSLSSVSTPSSPATPTGYDMNDFRWKRNGLDPRIYKEQHYTPSVISKSSSNKYWQYEDEKDKGYHPSVLSPSRNKFYLDDEDDDESVEGYSSKRHSHDYKPSSMRYSYSPSQTRSTSPSRDSYTSSRKYYQKSSNHSNYSSRPPSRATSVSSHATSIEEESAILRDILKEAEIMTMKNLTEQRNIFKQVDLSGVGLTSKNSGRSTPSVKGVGQKKSTTTTTSKTTTKTTKPSVKTSKTTQPTKISTTTKAPSRAPSRAQSRAGVATTTKGTLPNNKKISNHRPSSSLSSISSTSSYREAYQPPPSTNFSAAREALSRARMKVEEMLEIVSNGGTLD